MLLRAFTRMHWFDARTILPVRSLNSTLLHLHTFFHTCTDCELVDDVLTECDFVRRDPQGTCLGIPRQHLPRSKYALERIRTNLRQARTKSNKARSNTLPWPRTCTPQGGVQKYCIGPSFRPWSPVKARLWLALRFARAIARKIAALPGVAQQQALLAY